LNHIRQSVHFNYFLPLCTAALFFCFIFPVISRNTKNIKAADSIPVKSKTVYSAGSWKTTFSRAQNEIFTSEPLSDTPKSANHAEAPILKLADFNPMKDVNTPWEKISVPNQPFSLFLAIKTALNNNYSYRAKHEDFKIARENVGMALTYTAPRVKYQNRQTFLDSAASIGGITIGSDSYNISSFIIEQALYTFGKADSAFRLALNDKRLKTADLKLKGQSIILDTIKAYTEYLKADAAVNLSEKSLKVIKEYLDLVKTQYNAGVVLETDLLSTKVRLLEMRQKLITAQNYKSIALESLCNIMVVPVKDYIKPIELPNIKKFSISPQECEKYINNKLPEVETLKILIKINKEQLHLEKLKRNPDIGLQAAWASGTDFDEKDSNWNANLVFDFKFIDSGEANYNIRKAQYTLNKTKHQLDDLKQSIKFLINTKKFQENQLKEQMEIASELIKTSKKNTEQIKIQYMNGTTLNTDVLEAELSLSQARFQYINSRYDYIVTQAELYRNLGLIEEFVSEISIEPEKDKDRLDKVLLY
jgi:outer membrane protein TolC